MKEFLMKLFGIKTNEEEYLKLKDKNKNYESSIRTLNSTNRLLALQVIHLEDEVELLKKDPEQYIEKEIEKRTLDLEAEYEQKMIHKWYCIGRQDAYAEMGIKSIEAHERGNWLCILENGDIVELITALEDVKSNLPLEQATEFSGSLDEIIIDDLVGEND